MFNNRFIENKKEKSEEKILFFSKKSLTGLAFGDIIINCVIMAELSRPLSENCTFH